MSYNLLSDFMDKSTSQVLDIINSEHDQIVLLAKEIGDVIKNNGIIQVLGLEHDQAFPMELYFRAGGLIQYHRFNVSDLVLRGKYTTDDLLSPTFYDNKQLAHTLYNEYNVNENDAVFIFASTKIYDSLVEMAKLSKDKGHPVYLLLAKDLLKDDKNLEEIIQYADFVLDLGVKKEDEAYMYNDTPVTLIHNLAATMIAQSLTMEIYKYLVEENESPGVLWSLNIEGADEHNGSIMEQYDTRWNS